MKLGNIVTDKYVEFDKSINTVDSLSEIIPNLPTMIIGWDTTKKLFGDKSVSILEKEIDTNLFWTFSLRERRSVYENDIESFIQYCYNKSISDIKYVSVDPISFTHNMMKKTIRKILSGKNITSFIHNDNIFIYTDNLIFGIDLHLYEFYIGIEKNKLTNKIKSISHTFLDNDDLLVTYKDYLTRLGSVKYIPFLNQLDNE